ncbi:MAG: deoxyribodipyrimidine photo-lyase [Spirochaetia bacterium]|nr:deoxyribodipyrimidine photo-lyase [Spirochaetia bacterium]
MSAIRQLAVEAPVQASRLRFLPSGEARTGGAYVLFWMQKSQRSRDNPALELSVHMANALGIPLLCVFVLCEYPRAEAPQYRFMLQGLRSCAEEIRARGAAFALLQGEPAEQVLRYGAEAAVLVADEGKLSFERRWRDSIAASPGRPDMVIVETESVVPPAAVSDHLEWSAATIRRKISALLPFYLPRAAENEECCRIAFQGQPGDDSLFSQALGKEKRGAGGGEIEATAYKKGKALLSGGAEDEAAASRQGFGSLLHLQRLSLVSGQAVGMERFEDFLHSGGLERYATERNDPSAKAGSAMSAYLHFGQISPARLAQKALEHSASAAQAYVEQLVVRRELALNYVLHNPGYLEYKSAAPDWAQRSLASRTHPAKAYSDRELEEARTEDPYWNAAQKELILHGAIHNYMRMYWGKQLLQWFSDPSEAFSVALRLNDCYSLDGRDPNGYAGVAWCFGRHDRPWPERPGFGKVRAMMASGLRKKFDIERYAEEMDSIYTSRIKETL